MSVQRRDRLVKDSQAPQVVARRVHEVPVHSSRVAHLDSQYNHRNGWEEQYASTLPLKVKPKPTVYSSGHYVSKPQPHKSGSSRVVSGVCTQQIKPDSMCYSPVHYDRENEIAARIQNFNIRAPSPNPSADYTTVITVGESRPKISENRRPPPPARRVSSSIYISPSNPSNSRTASADSYDATVYKSNESPKPASIAIARPRPKVFYAGNSAVSSQSSTRDRSPSPARSVDELDRVRPARSGYGPRPVNYVPAPPYNPSHQREHLKSFSTSTLSKPWHHSGSPEDSFASNARDLRQISARIITDRPVCEKCRCVPIDRRQRLCAGCEQELYQMHSNSTRFYWGLMSHGRGGRGRLSRQTSLCSCAQFFPCSLSLPQRLLLYFPTNARGLYSRNARGKYKARVARRDIDMGKVPFFHRSPSARPSMIRSGTSVGEKAFPRNVRNSTRRNSTLIYTCGQNHISVEFYRSNFRHVFLS